MKVLRIQNVILIERAEIFFGKNLNILTGESGSGKSAILSAIRLIAGERADSHLIRQGADLAVVEAEFEGGIFIRREIYRSGKNRCFIDDAQVSLAELKEAVQIEMVDQNSSVLGKQKELLDFFSQLDLSDFEESVKEEKNTESQLQKLSQISKDRELEWAQKDLALIEETDWREEERLIEEHKFLTHAQEMIEKVGALNFCLNEGSELPNLRKALSLLETSTRFDSKLQPAALAMREALVELDEVARLVQSYADTIEVDPSRLERVEKKMAAIIQLKKRFGPEIEVHKQRLLSEIESLLNLDEQINTLQKAQAALSEKNFLWAQELLSKRKEMAPHLAEQVLNELKSLNLPHARFEIEVGKSLQDVRFLFSANPGHPPVPIQECASGGELSRLLLAIKTVLADGKSSLVFDEIDSNIGGKTAAVLGEKLKKLSESRQVICVTHFVQVARYASDHFLVVKDADGESAFTKIQKLSEKEKETEYYRMLGCLV